ncbi:MAG: hypothetical protein P4L49_18735 [Desulfosporosinus sp.]|nr:hypothetical protein [Desulfosporosinus sp.]
MLNWTQKPQHCRGFMERMHICLEEAQLTSAEKDQVDVLTAKYHSDEWNKIRL